MRSFPRRSDLCDEEEVITSKDNLVALFPGRRGLWDEDSLVNVLDVGVCLSDVMLCH